MPSLPSVRCNQLNILGGSYPNTTNRLFLKRIDGKNILDQANSNEDNQDGLKALFAVPNSCCHHISVSSHRFVQAFQRLAIVESASVTLANRCARIFKAADNTTVSACDVLSVLSLFAPSSSFPDSSTAADFTAIELAIDTSTNVMDDIGTALAANPARNAVNKAMFKSSLFGQPVPEGDDNFVLNSAATLVFDFTLINYDVSWCTLALLVGPFGRYCLHECHINHAVLCIVTCCTIS
jgi:hypothetical protein